MSSEKKVNDLLKSKNISFIQDVRYRPSENKYLLYLYKEKISDRAEDGFTSYRQLNQLKNSLKRYHDLDCDFIVLDYDEDEDKIADLLVRLKNEIKNKFLLTLKPFNKYITRSDSIIDNDYAGYPTLIAILRLIKIKQPINANDLLHDLIQTYEKTDIDWLNKKLDLLRKKKSLIRNADEKYVLTMKGLNSVPSGARSSSSDVERALELGKRKW